MIDAIHAVEAAVRFFGSDITDVSNDADAMAWLGPLVLDRHVPDADGVREGWSVRDAVDRWGVERRDSHRFVFPGRLPNAPEGSYARFDEDEVIGSVTEFYDPTFTAAEAAKLRGVNERTARKWLDRELVGPVMRMREGKTTVRKAYASWWFSVNPCPIVHDGEWCTRVDGHEGPCGLRPGTRPTPTNHMNGNGGDR
ncbi:hypothetical protein P2P98_08510 [Microbacterium sp. Kw_RZR3]|uniref:hypothetical protein n=1 Tax=Microbacterium sp. Kw_RZR3 TaxID=3032903 RepID=UPI0023DB726C|nr:hypothetical protein [Microbacterium sp. Kw_RZR3]MDF2046198.1 hypothetical protein [Microbacterium sp. Kw_RZR3]